MSKRIWSYALVVLLTAVISAGLHPLTALETSAQGGCHTFPETSKTVCGRFLDYWNKHGGLAQQGYPITNEFTEVSDLNGQSYTVQYFERAVFELHPENQPPNDVLLSQLGTFRLKEKYPSGDPSGGAPAPTSAQPTKPPAPQGNQQVSGTGTNLSSPLALKEGLAVYHAVVTKVGSARAYFTVNLLDESGRNLDAIAYEVGGNMDVLTAGRVPADGTYLFEVQSKGNWAITVSQPTGTYSAPPANQQFSGHGNQVTQLFSLKSGGARFHAVNTNGKGDFIVRLMGQDGYEVGSIAREEGAADLSKMDNIESDGVFLFVVKSDGDWTVTIQQ